MGTLIRMLCVHCVARGVTQSDEGTRWPRFIQIQGAGSMAKDNNTATNIGFEDRLWRAADALCSNIDAAGYKPAS